MEAFPSAIIFPLEEVAQEGSVYESASWLLPTQTQPRYFVNLLAFTGAEVRIFPPRTAELILFKE
jgi:hypothetical protein